MTPEEIDTLRLERDYWRLVAKDLPKARDEHYEIIRGLRPWVPDILHRLTV